MAVVQGVTVSQSGLVVGSVFLTTMLATPLVGKYIQTLGATNFLILGCFILGIGNISFGFLAWVTDTQAFFLLSVLVRVVTAVGEAALAPAAFSLVAQQVIQKLLML